MLLCNYFLQKFLNARCCNFNVITPFICSHKLHLHSVEIFWLWVVEI